MSDTATEAYRNLLRDLEQELSELGRRILFAADLARDAADDKSTDDDS